MTRPTWRAALALALLLAAAPLLAGCVGTAAASAAELRSEADNAAREWDATAKLAQAIGIEGTFPMMAAMAFAGYGAGTTEGSASAQEDEDVGDGKCEAWIYRYVADDKADVFVVVVDADGKVVHTETAERTDDDAALGAWNVDSDAAVEKALQANEGLRNGLGQEHFGFVSILGQHESAANAAWLIAGGGGSALGGGGGFVVIDAVTGDVLLSEGGFGGR